MTVLRRTGRRLSPTTTPGGPPPATTASGPPGAQQSPSTRPPPPGCRPRSSTPSPATSPDPPATPNKPPGRWPPSDAGPGSELTGGPVSLPRAAVQCLVGPGPVKGACGVADAMAQAPPWTAPGPSRETAPMRERPTPHEPQVPRPAALESKRLNRPINPEFSQVRAPRNSQELPGDYPGIRPLPI